MFSFFEEVGGGGQEGGKGPKRSSSFGISSSSSSSSSRSGPPKARPSTPMMTRPRGPRSSSSSSSFSGSPSFSSSFDSSQGLEVVTPTRTGEEIAELKVEQGKALCSFAAIDEKYRLIANEEKKAIFRTHVDYLLGLQHVGPTSENVCNHLKQLCSSLLSETEELLEVLAKFITREGEEGSHIIPKYDVHGYPLPEEFAPFWRKRDENEKLQRKSFWAMQLMVDERLCGRLISTKLNRFLTLILPSFEANSNANLFHVQKLMSYLLQNGDQEAFRHYCYQPKVMSKMLNVLHYPPVSDFLLQLFLLPSSFDIHEKSSLWMHLEVGRFFPTLFQMICDQHNPTIASNATDFFQRLIKETYDRVEHIHLLFEQILKAELFEKFIISLEQKQKAGVQLTDMTKMLSILLQTTAVGTPPPTSSTPPSSLGTLFAPLTQKFAPPVTVNYLQPFREKLINALKKHLGALLRCLTSPSSSTETETTTSSPLKLLPHHIFLLETIFLLMVKVPKQEAGGRGGGGARGRGRGRGRGGAVAGGRGDVVGAKVGEKEGRAEVDGKIVDEILKSGIWGNVVEWCVTIQHNAFFHKVFFNLFKTIIHTNHSPTLHHLLYDLQMATKLRKSFLKTLVAPSTSHAYVCLYLNMIRLCGDLQYWSSGFNRTMVTEQTVMNYLLSDKEWWEFLPTLLEETGKQTIIPNVKGKRAKKPGIPSPGNYTTLFFTPSAPLAPLDLPPQFSPGTSLGSSFGCSLGFPSPSPSVGNCSLPSPFEEEKGKLPTSPQAMPSSTTVVLRELEGRTSSGNDKNSSGTNSPSNPRSSSHGNPTFPSSLFQKEGGKRQDFPSPISLSGFSDETPVVVQPSSLSSSREKGEEALDVVGKKLGEAMRMVGFGEIEREREKERERRKYGEVEEEEKKREEERKRQREREKEIERKKYGEMGEEEKEREEERKRREERERKAREWEEMEEKALFNSVEEDEEQEEGDRKQEEGDRKQEEGDDQRESSKGEGKEGEEEESEEEIDRLILSPPPLSDFRE